MMHLYGRCVFVFFSRVSEATPLFSKKAHALPQLTIDVKSFIAYF